jgi:putative flippase GtrA
VIDVAQRSTPGEVLRFLIVGGANTLLTGAIFLALSSVVPATVAYTVAFAVGIGFAALVTPHVVFRTRATTRQRFRYVVWYLTIYVMGLATVYVLRDRLLLSTTFVAAVTFVATAGLSFLGARFLFADGRDTDAGGTNADREP